jgi:hypothetical protein
MLHGGKAKSTLASDTLTPSRTHLSPNLLRVREARGVASTTSSTLHPHPSTSCAACCLICSGAGVTADC